MGDPVHELVVVKSTPVITAPLLRYIERSPFACLATYGADGTCDLSPHCSKAFRRSKLWQDDYVAHEGVPTLSEMMSGHLNLDKEMAAQLDAGIEADVQTRMY